MLRRTSPGMTFLPAARSYKSTDLVGLRRLIRIAPAWLPLIIVAPIACGTVASCLNSVRSRVKEAARP